jgi:hypothetical protein
MAILAQRFKDTPRINITLRVQRFQTVLFYMVLQTQRYQQISNWEILLWVSYLGTYDVKEKEREKQSTRKVHDATMQTPCLQRPREEGTSMLPPKSWKPCTSILTFLISSS